MKSPCINVCKLNSAQNICVGCYRSIGEIASWASLTDKEKQIVLVNAEKRKNDYMGSSRQ